MTFGWQAGPAGQTQRNSHRCSLPSQPPPFLQTPARPCRDQCRPEQPKRSRSLVIIRSAVLDTVLLKCPPPRKSTSVQPEPYLSVTDHAPPGVCRLLFARPLGIRFVQARATNSVKLPPLLSGQVYGFGYWVRCGTEIEYTSRSHYYALFIGLCGT